MTGSQSLVDGFTVCVGVSSRNGDGVVLILDDGMAGNLPSARAMTKRHAAMKKRTKNLAWKAISDGRDGMDGMRRWKDGEDGGETERERREREEEEEKRGEEEKRREEGTAGQVLGFPVREGSPDSTVRRLPRHSSDHSGAMPWSRRSFDGSAHGTTRWPAANPGWSRNPSCNAWIIYNS